MKAKMPQQLKLTIGMIVKNEEEHIRNCLEALQPLLQNVESELIIADTGSSDNTLRIAQEYTDQAFAFDWNNDFSAARNATLDKARGEWYMFVDADEYLDDSEDMIRFFNSSERKKYNTATFLIRSFTDTTYTTYTEFRGVRCCRLATGNRFHGSIHEAIFVVAPVKQLNSTVKHYGYVYKNKEDMDKKMERNMSLMLQEYEKNPDDPRLMVLLADSCPSEDKARYLEHGIELVRGKPNDTYFGSVYNRAIREYVRLQDWDRCREIADEYFEQKQAKEKVIDLEIHAMLAEAYNTQKKYQEASVEYEKYFELFDKVENNLLDTYEMIYSQLVYTQKLVYYSTVQHAANSYCYQRNYEYALNIMMRMNYDEMGLAVFRSALSSLVNVIDAAKRMNYFVTFYRLIREINDKEKVKCYTDIVENYYYTHEQSHKQLAHEFAESEYQDDSIVKFMALIDKQDDNDTFVEELDQYLEDAEYGSIGFTEILWMTLKYNRNILPIAHKCSSRQIQELLDCFVIYHKDDYIQVIVDYCFQAIETSSAKELFFVSSVQSLAVLGVKEKRDIKSEQKVNLFKDFVKNLSVYTMMIYNPNLFQLNEFDVIPELYQFGYYMYLANEALKRNNEVEYIKFMREALKLCPEMKHVISLLLNDFSEKKNSIQKEKALLEEYTTKVRNKILEIASQGFKDEAQKLALEYLKMKPSDHEIRSIIDNTANIMV